MVRRGEDQAQLDHLSALTKALSQVEPQVTDLSVSVEKDWDTRFDFVAGTLSEQLPVPVRMVSFGPTERDKYCK